MAHMEAVGAIGGGCSRAGGELLHIESQMLYYILYCSAIAVEEVAVA